MICTNGTLKAEGAHDRLAFEPCARATAQLPLAQDTALTGAELDVGSNPQDYWLWVKRNEPKAFFYGRHDQYAQSQARQILPIEPEWLIEAFGLVTFDPAQPIEGPICAAGN
ncbi:MAG: hypothetical protein QM811_28640 [Pirellulales bacterium]